jgi:outer membrane protein
MHALFLVMVAAQAEVITLEAAIKTAHVAQPQLRQARAQTDVFRARADVARAPLLPQVNGNAGYQRTTSNFVLRPGQNPNNTMGAAPTFDTFNFWTFGLSLSQQIYDSQVTIDRWRAARVTAESAAATEQFAALGVELNVRTAFFAARARKSLVDVAKETLANQERRFQQVEGFVRVGARPEIDLAQARTDRANAKVQLIRADANYAAAKAQLNLAMGIERSTDYEVAAETLPPVDVEERDLDTLADEARKARPDVTALERQVRAQELTIRSTWGGFGPSISATMGLTDNGGDITNLGWNWNASLNVNWNLFAGLLTWSQVKEQKAQLSSLKAQLDAARQQVRLDSEQARLAVHAAKGSIEAAEEALVNARERLRLAQGRYGAGVGNSLELSDSQLALTNAAAQRVQADFDLATARAQLLRALGRRGTVLSN